MKTASEGVSEREGERERELCANLSTGKVFVSVSPKMRETDEKRENTPDRRNFMCDENLGNMKICFHRICILRGNIFKTTISI